MEEGAISSRSSISVDSQVKKSTKDEQIRNRRSSSKRSSSSDSRRRHKRYI